MEEWRPIPGFEGLYEASNHGRVRSIDRICEIRMPYGVRRRFYKGKVLSGGPHKGGYVLLHLYKNSARHVTTVHACVALAFLGPAPAGMVVCHRDGNAEDSRLSNLRYGTPLENSADRVVHGTALSGEASPVAKLSAADVIAIRSSRGENQHVVAARYGVTNSNISAIQLGKSWKQL